MIGKNKLRIVSYFNENPGLLVNVNQMSRILGISLGSSHKLMKELEQEGVLKSESSANSILYGLIPENENNLKYIQYLKEEKKKITIKKTKIICTIGPASNDVSLIRQLIQEGMNIARINGSHGTPESNLKIIENIRAASPSVPIMLDIPGNKIRLGHFPFELSVEENEEIRLTPEIKFNEKEKVIPIDCKDFHLRIKEGGKVLLDDGTIELEIIKVDEREVICRVRNKGIIKQRKGVNIPNSNFSSSEISSKDLNLIVYAVKNNLDFIGLSFARDSEHIKEVLKLLDSSKIRLISKIETGDGVRNYREIIDSSYGIMIDRGDLGSETKQELVPVLQKKIIQECNSQGKPVIIATQMLDSMTFNPFPTKAEISDVANAVLDGASVVMLSGETAAGKYPVRSCRTMREVILNVEQEMINEIHGSELNVDDLTDAIGLAIKNIVSQIRIDKVICITSGGYSARMISRFKLDVSIIGITDDFYRCRQINILWGVTPFLIEGLKLDNSGSVNQKREVIIKLLEEGIIKDTDTVLITGAIFPNNHKINNMIEIHNVKDFLGFFEVDKDGK
jgi:pyruvate kinase